MDPGDIPEKQPRVALALKWTDPPREYKDYQSVTGLSNIFDTIETWDDFVTYVEKTYSLERRGLCISDFFATTRPSLGELEPLAKWDLEDEMLTSWNWEGVLAVAEVQGWLGVSFTVEEAEDDDTEEEKVRKKKTAKKGRKVGQRKHY